MPVASLAVYLAVLALQRAAELWLSSRNSRRLAAAGAIEHGRGHYPWIVFVHTLFPACLVAEIAWLGARPGPSWPVWLAVWLAAQGLRYWAVASLGERWSTRIWILPGAPLVARGPYRGLRHPNYLAVAVEMLAAPLMFGAWRTALLVSALDLVVLRVRIRAEDRALDSSRGLGHDASSPRSPDVR